MKKILILGHKGMLGNAVYKYFGAKPEEFLLLTVTDRWDTEEFKNNTALLEADYIINCVGIIPQKKPAPEAYQKVNVDLPIFLETLNKRVIHPSTDCEFSGVLEPTEMYTKESVRDAEDIYGKSKADISKMIQSSFKNTKIIRTSIIGHEEGTNLSLLDWFLHAEGTVNGYTNHYWNGITTLEWAKRCEELINSWDTYSALTQYGTDSVRSKYDLLNDIQDVYQKEITITPFDAPTGANKCLLSDAPVKPIKEQLTELRAFYNK